MRVLIVLLAVATLATLVTAIPNNLQPRSLFKKLKSIGKSRSKGSSSAPNYGWEAESSAQPDHCPEDPSADTCGICLENIQTGEDTRPCTFCKNKFHTSCIDEWNRVQATCPSCREEDPETVSNISQRERFEAEARERNPHEEQLSRLEALVQENEDHLTRNYPGHREFSRANYLEDNEARLARVKHLVRQHERFLHDKGYSSSRLMKNVDSGNDFYSRLNRMERLATYHKGWLEKDERQHESESESEYEYESESD